MGNTLGVWQVCLRIVGLQQILPEYGRQINRSLWFLTTCQRYHHHRLPFWAKTVSQKGHQIGQTDRPGYGNPTVIIIFRSEPAQARGCLVDARRQLLRRPQTAQGRDERPQLGQSYGDGEAVPGTVGQRIQQKERMFGMRRTLGENGVKTATVGRH